MTTAAQLRVGSIARGSERFTNQEGMEYPLAISAETVRTTGVFLGKVTIPPGGRTKVHRHEAHDSADSTRGGEEVEIFTGDRLEDRQVVCPGDYWFIPAVVPHVAVNRGTTPAVFIGARREPTAKESQITRPERDALLP